MKDYKGNEGYMKKMMGKSPKLMSNHGNTKPIKVDGQKDDMGRLQRRPMEKRGYSDKAFEYKY